MRQLSVFIFTFGVLATTVSTYSNDLQTIFQFKQPIFEFPSQKDLLIALDNRTFVPGNSIPVDVAPFYNAKGQLFIFITLQKFKSGVPFTLATIAPNAGGVPILRPYPSYKWHSSNGENCDYITSAFRIVINECNQMWVLDSGVIGTDQLCPPQLLLFDLNTDKLLHRYRFSPSVYTPVASLLITHIVVTRDPPPYGKCQNSMVYIADSENPGLIIYDQKQGMSWRAENKYMYPDPEYGTYTIAGVTFTLMGGIFGMSTNKRSLYFHPLASISEYSVPLSVLDNKANWENDANSMENEFIKLGNDSQAALEAMDSRGNIYWVNLKPIRLVRWNIRTPFTQPNFRVLSTDANALQFVSGMKVIRNVAGQEELWLLSNRYQKFATNTLNPNEINFRILRRNLNDIY